MSIHLSICLPISFNLKNIYPSTNLPWIWDNFPVTELWEYFRWEKYNFHFSLHRVKDPVTVFKGPVSVIPSNSLWKKCQCPIHSDTLKSFEWILYKCKLIIFNCIRCSMLLQYSDISFSTSDKLISNIYHIINQIKIQGYRCESGIWHLCKKGYLKLQVLVFRRNWQNSLWFLYETFGSLFLVQ